MTTKDVPKIARLIKKKEKLLNKIAHIGLQLELFEAVALASASAPKALKPQVAAKPVEEEKAGPREPSAAAKTKMAAAARARWAKATAKKTV